MSGCPIPFYLGAPEPAWLKRTAVPLFLSRRRLARQRSLPRARGPWALDSGGFTELSLYGHWRTGERQYVAEVEAWSREVGRLEWAAVQDWMCEPLILARTGRSVREHQQRTVASYLSLRDHRPELPWLPVLQGWEAEDYRRHVDLYAAAQIDLTRLPLVGLGSVCRRQHTPQLLAICSALAGLGLRLHGFGVKRQGRRQAGELLVSSDSMAWSYQARRHPPLSGCRHRHCANCLTYALRWRKQFLSDARETETIQLQPAAGDASMSTDLVSIHVTSSNFLDRAPAPIAAAGEHANRRFFEFFTANIRNPNTRQAYYRNALAFFAWLEQRGLTDLHRIEPMVVAAYIEQLQGTLSPPSVKQHLAGIRMLFDWLVVGQVVPTNPASSVRGPKYVVKKGKTPVLEADDARRLLDSIKIECKVDRRREETVPDVVGLRDRALIAVMVYSFARVGAVVGMRVEDYYQVGRRSWLRLHEKGGKFHEVPAHHNAEAYLDAYLEVAGIATDKKSALFRSTVGKTRRLTADAMHRVDVFRMIKRRAKAAGVSELVCCHTFRATGITVYLQNGGTLEKAQQIAAHESARTTKLYDRTQDQISLDEVERIAI